MAGDIFISQYRKTQVVRKHQSTFALEINTDSPEQQMQYAELKAKYERALADLPEKQRTVFLMSRMEDMSYKEIADNLQLSVKAVEKRMSQALATLKTRMNVT